MALGQLVNGQWTKEWTERNESGQFQRMPTQFRHQITADGSSGFGRTDATTFTFRWVVRGHTTPRCFEAERIGRSGRVVDR